MVSGDQQYCVACPFDYLVIGNAMVPLMMLLISPDTDTSASGIMTNIYTSKHACMYLIYICIYIHQIFVSAYIHTYMPKYMHPYMHTCIHADLFMSAYIPT